MKKLSILMVALCTACGSSSGSGATGSGSASGSVDSKSLNVADAVFFTVAGNSSNGNTQTVVVGLSSLSGICADAELALNSNGTSANANTAIPSSYTALTLSVSSVASDVTAKSYAVDSSLVTADLSAVSTTGTSTYAATGGNITFSTVTPTQVKGTFALSTFTSQSSDVAGSLSGSFTASNCNALAQLLGAR